MTLAIIASIHSNKNTANQLGIYYLHKAYRQPSSEGYTGFSNSMCHIFKCDDVFCQPYFTCHLLTFEEKHRSKMEKMKIRWKESNSFILWRKVSKCWYWMFLRKMLQLLEIVCEYIDYHRYLFSVILPKIGKLAKYSTYYINE